MKPQHKGLTAKQKIILVVMDVLLLVELAVSLLLSGSDPQTMTGAFLRMYVPLLVATVGGGILLMRKAGAQGT